MLLFAGILSLCLTLRGEVSNRFLRENLESRDTYKKNLAKTWSVFMLTKKSKTLDQFCVDFLNNSILFIKLFNILEPFS